MEFALTELIAPIAGDVAAGVDVRLAGAGSELYLTVKDERASARVAEREALAAGDPEVDPLSAGIRSWNAVAAGGAQLLVEASKDLQIAAWLVEAWLRTDGLPGLADGFTLLAELVEHYWDEGLFPNDPDDFIEERMAPLYGLFGREEAGALVQPLKLLRLTDVGAEPVALWSIEAIRGQSVRHEDPEMREQLVAKRAQRIEQLDAAVAAASPDFVTDSLDAIDRALKEIDRLMEAIDRKAGQGRFGSQVVAPLEAIADVLNQQHVRTTAPPQAQAADGGGVDAPAATMPPGEPQAIEQAPPKRNLRNRDSALATLIEIACFFDETEPQSLIGQGLREVVRRAGLPLDELLAELLPDQEQRSMFMLRAGIRADVAKRDEGFTTF